MKSFDDVVAYLRQQTIALNRANAEAMRRDGVDEETISRCCEQNDHACAETLQDIARVFFVEEKAPTYRVQ